MDPVLFRLGVIAVVSFAPVLARLIFLFMTPDEHERMSPRHLIIAFVMAFVGLMLSWKLNRAGWQNFDFAGFYMIFGVFSLLFHAGALPMRSRGYVENAVERRRFRLSMCVILPMFACTIAPIYLARDLDERIINETLAATSSPDVTFVPSQVEMAMVNGREVFQLRTRRTSIRETDDKLVVISVPRTPGNDAVLLPIRADLARGSLSTVILNVQGNAIESANVVTLAAHEIKRLNKF